jgi:hypothetical protein
VWSPGAHALLELKPSEEVQQDGRLGLSMLQDANDSLGSCVVLNRLRGGHGEDGESSGRGVNGSMSLPVHLQEAWQSEEK